MMMMIMTQCFCFLMTRINLWRQFLKLPDQSSPFWYTFGLDLFMMDGKYQWIHPTPIQLQWLATLPQTGSATPAVLQALEKKTIVECPQKGLKYFCERCDIKFSHHQTFKDHTAKIHNTKPGHKPFECEEEGCKKGYAEQKELRDHIHFLHKKIPVICQTCHQKFYSWRGMYKHKKKMHKKQ